MLIIGCDFHPSVQQIACLDAETGEYSEQRLSHSNGEAERFYRGLHQKTDSIRVGIEATGHARWFERLLGELGCELWIGDPAQIRAMRVRRQKTDRQDAQLLLKLMLDGRFPRIWAPSPKNRDLRQLLWHRHRLVQMRTRIMNQLQAVAMNEGVRRKQGLWSKAGRAQLESLSLDPWATRRREDLMRLLDQLNLNIDGLTKALEKEASDRLEVRYLMSHPGVGSLTALAFVLIIGSPDRFHCGKQISSYLGLIPCEESSADRQRLGHITKQGNSLMRFFLGEAAQTAVRCDSNWRRQYLHLMMRRSRQIAKVAMARKLAVQLYWMWRKEMERQRTLKIGPHARLLV
jgi:transposase